MGFCLVFIVTSVFWGHSATSKRVNDVGVLSGCMLATLPGLVEAIVLTLRHSCSHETISTSLCLSYNIHRSKRIGVKSYIISPNSCCYDIYQNTDGVAFWYYVTAITHHDVTQAQKQSFKRLRTVPER